MTTKQKIETALKEASVALSELQKDLEKKPEDKILEKLDEILRAVQAQGYGFHVCPYPHYPQRPWTAPYGTWITTYGTGLNTTGTIQSQSGTLTIQNNGMFGSDSNIENWGN